jgi:hypothetical protein
MITQPMKPPAAVKLTNQPKTVLAPREMLMKDKRENKDYPFLVQLVIHYDRTRTILTQKATEMSGSPAFVTRLKISGACPRMESPYKAREEEYRRLLPAEKALVKTAALIMCGRTLIPARFMAMTYGLRENGETNQQGSRELSPLSGITCWLQQGGVIVGYEHTRDEDTENLQ